MIEIIAKGNKRPEDRTYRNTCGHCGSILQFKGNDGREVSDQREGDAIVIDCPVCAAEVWTAKSAYQNKPMSDADIKSLTRRMGG